MSIDLGILELIEELKQPGIPLHRIEDAMDYADNAQRTIEDRAELIIELQTAAESALAQVA